MTDAATPPAGWYPAPDLAGSQRYWNGAAWTDDFAPTGSPILTSTHVTPTAQPSSALRFKALLAPDDVVMTLTSTHLSWKNTTSVTRIVLSWTMALCTLGFSLLVYPPGGGKKYGGSLARQQILGATSRRVFANTAELTIMTTGTPVVFQTDAGTASQFLDALQG